MAMFACNKNVYFKEEFFEKKKIEVGGGKGVRGPVGGDFLKGGDVFQVVCIIFNTTKLP